jgi:hypothetical protein
LAAASRQRYPTRQGGRGADWRGADEKANEASGLAGF